MEFHFQHKTYKTYGGHDYLEMINRLLDADELFCGSAIKRIDVQVNFKPLEHVKLMYDEKTNRTKENPDYLFQRNKKTLKIIYLSMVSTHEEEEDYYRGQALEAEKFNELCYEFRDYLTGISQELKPKDDFQLSQLLAYIDKKFAILPISDSALNSMFEEYEKEKDEFYQESHEREKAGLSGGELSVDTSTNEIPPDSDSTKFPIEKVSWMYGDRKFDDFDEFVKELTSYCWECTDYEGQIEDFEICHGDKVSIKFFGKAEGEKDCIAQVIEINRPNKKITFLEFMFITYNELFEFLKGTDHVYYEGYEFLKNENDIPLVQLIQGS